MAQPPVWTVDHDQSRLTFLATQLGSEFEGVFSNFEAEIVFDRDDLANSLARVTIDIGSLDTGEDQRDGQAKGPEFFDVANHPTATFQTTSISASDSGYLADGILHMKGITNPIQLPFTLDFEEDSVRMTGSLVIDRTEWEVGTGEWLSGDTVGKQVEIRVDLAAFK